MNNKEKTVGEIIDDLHNASKELVKAVKAATPRLKAGVKAISDAVGKLKPVRAIEIKKLPNKEE